MSKIPNIIAIIGPTASGKSDFAVDLALKENGEIISVDSRQIYIGLDLGTGKITKEEMKNIPHHMLDICNIEEEMSVSIFSQTAINIIEDILKREKTPILCGGTGQYIQAIIYKNTFAKVEPNIKLRNELEKLSNEELVSKLEKLDTERLSNIDKQNRHRLMRAIEIAESIGKVPKLEKPELRYETKIFLLEKSREDLRKSIDARLEKRLLAGMLEEGRKVFEMNLPKSKISKLGIEYISMCKYLNNEITEQEMKTEIITKSYQYAKRQMTWNKKYFKDAEIIKK